MYILFYLVSFTQHSCFEIHLVVAAMVIHSLLLLNSIPLYGYTIICLPLCWLEDVFLVWDYYE